MTVTWIHNTTDHDIEPTAPPVTTATMLIEGGRTKIVTIGGEGTVITIDYVLEPIVHPGTNVTIAHQASTSL